MANLTRYRGGYRNVYRSGYRVPGADLDNRMPTRRNQMAGLADLDQSQPTMTTPADGFTYNANLRYLPYRSFPLLVGQLDELRTHRNNYRGRYYTLPYNLSYYIPAYEVFDAGQRMAPNTVVWGLQFAAIDGNVSDYRVQITDICSGIPFFSEMIVATALRPTGVTELYPVLVEPRCITGGANPGLKIEIANNAAVPQRCQLLILCAEPCMDQGVGPEPAPAFPWEYRGTV